MKTWKSMCLVILLFITSHSSASADSCVPTNGNLYDDGGQCPCSKGEGSVFGCPDPSIWPDTWYTTVWRGAYGERRTLNLCERREGTGNHPGIDLKDVTNNPFLKNGRYAALVAGPVVSVNRDGWGNGWGNYVVQRVQSVNRNGNLVSYMCFMGHLENNSIPGELEYGNWVTCGEDLGDIGSTGNSTGPHGHWQCQICDDVLCQNEVKFFGDSTCKSPVTDCDGGVLCVDGPTVLDCVADKTINPIVALQDPDNDGYARLHGDCDWNNSAIHPDVREHCSDGLDNNCNGLVDAYDPHCGAEPTMLSQMFFSDPASGGAYDIGEIVTASVVLRNNSSVPITLKDVTIGCRLNNADNCWNYDNEPNREKCGEPDCPEFTTRTNVTIQAGQNYNYTGTFSPNQNGIYACKVYYRVGPLECKGWNWDIPKAAAGYATTAYLSVADECAPPQSLARSSTRLQSSEDLCNPTPCSGKSAGQSCDDGLYCTVGDQCVSNNGTLVCQGATRTCNDGDSCTTDSCNENTNACNFSAITNCGQTGQCAGKANGTPCNDNNACTLLDQCLNGQCISNANDCSQFNTQCSTGVCDPAVGCVQQPKNNGTSCNDGLLCTETDTCQNGQCVGAARNCNDNNPCTVDTCSEQTLCNNIPGNAGAVCRNALWACDAPEVCNGYSDVCPEHRNENIAAAGTSCSDGIFCNGHETCAADGYCYPGDEPCPYGLTTCNYYACDESTDSCNVIGYKDRSIRCDDGLFCTQYDECDGQGNCTSYGNPCNEHFADGDADCSEMCDETADSCSGPDPYSFNCTDNVWCNGVERCSNGECTLPGTPRCQAGELCDENNRTCILLTPTSVATPTHTQQPTASPTTINSPTATRTNTKLPTPTRSATPTHSPVATYTITPLPSATRTHTNTLTPSIAPTSTQLPVATLAFTPSASTTPLPSITHNATATRTVTATVAPHSTATRSATASPSPSQTIGEILITPIDCPTQPSTGCVATTHSSVSVRMVDRINLLRTNRLTVRMQSETETSTLGNPTEWMQQTLCIYDGNTLVADIPIPAERTCTTPPCWTQISPNSFRWQGTNNTHGIDYVRVSTTDKNLVLALMAKGEQVPRFELPIYNSHLNVQWHINATPCFAAVFYPSSTTTKQTTLSFMGR